MTRSAPVEAGTVSWREVLRDAADQLERCGIPDARLSARRMVEEASGSEGADYILALDEPVTERSIAHFDEMLARRCAGEPLQYVLGRWGFRLLDLIVDDRVLIPRPETEQVVQHALAELARMRSEPDHPQVAVDLGTGSGAIALSLAVECRDVQVWGTDLSQGALDVARANLAGIGRPARRVRLAAGNWFAALPTELEGKVDLIVSNPPYVAQAEELPDEVARWEPTQALVAGPSGLEAFGELFASAGAWLGPAGAIVVEMAPHQRRAVIQIAGEAGFELAVHEDLAGLARIGVGRRS